MSAQPMMFNPDGCGGSSWPTASSTSGSSRRPTTRSCGSSPSPPTRSPPSGQLPEGGARALRAANVTVDVDVIERSFSELEARFETRVTDAVDEIARTTTGLLDADDGALTGTLSSFQAELSQLLGDTFDADSKSSVLANIEQLVLGTMKGLITPEIADSPIGRLKTELVDTMQREVGDIAEELRRVTEHLGILDATDEVYEQTTGKGFDYEDLVDECIGHAGRQLRRPRRGHRQAVGLHARRTWATRSSPSTATTPTGSRPASRSR